MAQPGPCVLQVIPELAAGGAERTTLEIAEALKVAGGRALVVSEGGRMEQEVAELGGELIRLPVKSKSPITLWKNRAKLIRIIHDEKVDIVHARSRAPAWSALWAARATDTPFVTTYHGAYGGTSAPKIFYNSVMARGDIVIANSEYIAGHVRNIHHVSEDRLVTIPRGVDLRIFDTEKTDPAKVSALRDELAQPDKKLLILPGRLTDWKGQSDLIEALAILPERTREQLAVQLIGDAQGRTAYVDSLHQAIKSHGLDDLVKISGHYSDMPTLYAACDLVLAPSKRPEAFGRIAIEAAAMGKPVIASDHGGQRETVLSGTTGWLVEPGNPAMIASAIQSFTEQDDTARTAMSYTAKNRVREQFSTAALQSSTLAVYDRLLNRQGGYKE